MLKKIKRLSNTDEIYNEIVNDTGHIFQTLFKGNCKLFFVVVVVFLQKHILPFAFLFTQPNNICQISSGKLKSICNCIPHGLRVITLSDLNPVKYHSIPQCPHYTSTVRSQPSTDGQVSVQGIGNANTKGFLIPFEFLAVSIDATEEVKKQMGYLLLLFPYDRVITHKTWEMQLQIDFAFPFETQQTLYIHENGNTRFAFSFELCNNLCVHKYKMHLRGPFRISFENLSRMY